MAAEPFIHLAGVAKSYGSGPRAHLAISDVTFDVMPGELACLVGPSGCGKSTLLKILAGLHPHNAGTVKIGSGSVPFDPAKDIGMVFQAPLLLKWRTILDNVLLPAEILGLPEKESRERARALLALGDAVYRDDRGASIRVRAEVAAIERRMEALNMELSQIDRREHERIAHAQMEGQPTNVVVPEPQPEPSEPPGPVIVPEPEPVPHEPPGPVIVPEPAPPDPTS